MYLLIHLSISICIDQHVHGIHHYRSFQVQGSPVGFATTCVYLCKHVSLDCTKRHGTPRIKTTKPGCRGLGLRTLVQHAWRHDL